MKLCVATIIAAAAVGGAGGAYAQTAPTTAPASTCLPKSWRDPQPTYRSVEVLPDAHVIFRICAPLARQAKVVSPDLAGVVPAGLTDGVPNGLLMTRDATGLWSVTTPLSIAADTYRFNFQVDGAPVPDPRGTTWSEQLNGITGTFEVPGAAGAFQSYDPAIPHGTVSLVEYRSNSLGGTRRAHVYTPPGYMKGSQRYPVLYLVHGAGDNDDSWTSVGHAHYILDRLIASGKARPMIIVMPAGHTPAREGQNILHNDDFGADLTRDLIPTIDQTFRTIARPDDRAMAGLSMGGAHTLYFGLPRSDVFHYVGIFSMGIGVENPASEVMQYKSVNAAALKRSAKAMKLVYYAIGKDDFLHATVAPTQKILDEFGIKYTFKESDGGHTWTNWRRYLLDFAPRLFKK